MGDCPVCEKTFTDAQELQTHVNAHFDAADDDEVQILEDSASRAAAAEPSATAAAAACPQCGAAVPSADLGSHLLAHQLEQEELQQLQGRLSNAAGAAGGSAAAGDGAGGSASADDAAAAAALAAAEWGDEGASLAGWDGGEGLGAGEAAAHQAQLEELYFEELRSKYGFSAALRQGTCRLCGEGGHWARECPRNPEVVAAAARVVDPPTPAAIVALQQRAHPTALAGAGLVPLLAACLEAQPMLRGAAPVDYAVALCGPVQHFGATLFSSGWGCGYNNMQVVASHLLAARPEARGVLFGGAGWVPDISSLQAWLEAAWQAGFDPQGAEQLGGRVQGTHKWVGTTEAAALFRSFGLRAQIVDFGTQQGQGGQPAMTPAAVVPGSVPVHPHVECDGCGQLPIVGDRYNSESRPNYDLCAACHGSPAAAASGPYRRMMPGGHQLAGNSSAAASHGMGSGGSGTVADQLLQWVWRHFTTDEGPGSAASTLLALAPTGDAEAGSAKRLRLDAAQVRLSGKAPLYFQHEGHSRNIIGIERRLLGSERRAEYTLLVLDPSTSAAKLTAALQTRVGWQRLLKRGRHTLRHGQYQLMFVAPGLAHAAELQALKAVAASERY